MHPNAYISSADAIPDPYLVAIGEGSVIGAGAMISGHYTPSASIVVLGRVTIGKNALVGRGASVWPNVTIGDGAIVQERAAVMPGTVIPANEIWVASRQSR